MQKLSMLTPLIFLFVFVLSCSNTPKETSLGKEERRAIVNKYNELLATYFRTGNAEKLASLYTDSAKLSPNGYDFVTGRKNIQAFWKKDFESSKLLEMSTEVFTTDGTDPYIYETGKTTTKTLYRDSIYKVTVKYINVWIKQPTGNYLLDIDFFE